MGKNPKPLDRNDSDYRVMVLTVDGEQKTYAFPVDDFADLQEDLSRKERINKYAKGPYQVPVLSMPTIYVVSESFLWRGRRIGEVKNKDKKLKVSQAALEQWARANDDAISHRCIA